MIHKKLAFYGVPSVSTQAFREVVLAAAQPIAIDWRDAFLQAVAHALQGCAEPGPGDIHRAVVSAQRAYCDYPDLSRTQDSPKYSRMVRRG